MRFYFLDLDFAIEDAHFALNKALKSARECGDPENWEALARFIENLEKAKDLLRIPAGIEEAIMWEEMEFQNEDDLNDVQQY